MSFFIKRTTLKSLKNICNNFYGPLTSLLYLYPNLRHIEHALKILLEYIQIYRQTYRKILGSISMTIDDISFKSAKRPNQISYLLYLNL